MDIILDPLGGSDTHKAYNLLKPMGKLIAYGKCVEVRSVSSSFAFSFSVRHVQKNKKS